jgi:hypothetical protein
MHRPVLLFLFALLLALSLPSSTLSAKQTSRGIRIKNSSNSLLALYWISVPKGQYVNQMTADLLPGASANINSFVGHTFAVVRLSGGCYLPDRVTVAGTASPGDEVTVCDEDRFSVSMGENQVIIASGGDKNNKNTGGAFKVVLEDDNVRVMEGVTDSVDACLERSSASDVAAGATKACLEQAIIKKVNEINDKYEFEKTLRIDMAKLIENYTCADANLPTSKPLEKTTWKYKRASDGFSEHARKVEVLFDNKFAKVHTIQDFISQEECAAVEKKAAKSLHRATVADDGGGSKYTPNRKALQSGVTVDWDKEKSGDAIAVLSRRIYEYTNHVTNFNLSVEGQEDIMSIQYKGRGENDDEPDRYMPHCDGECNGDEFREGNRVATMVVYCAVPEIGGATNFAKSNVHIVPTVGSATFFSYAATVEDVDEWPDYEASGDVGKSSVMAINDNQFSEHSGCPVIKGEKKIVTQWMRKGVSADTPWDAFNTMGVKKSLLKELMEESRSNNGKKGKGGSEL